jgi:hypothetical protein
MMGSHLTFAAPEAAPDVVFAGDAATLKPEQFPQRSSRLHSSVASCRPPFSKARSNSNKTDRAVTDGELQTQCQVSPAFLSFHLLRRCGASIFGVLELQKSL